MPAHSRAGRMNPGGATNDSQQSGRKVRDTLNPTVDDHHHQSQTKNRNAHTDASSSSRSRLPTGKDDGVCSNQAGPAHSTKTRSSCPQLSQPSRPSPGQSNSGSDALQVDAHTTKKRDKKTLRRNMDRGPGFDSGPGPSTLSAKSTRHRVQREPGAVPVPVPVKGTRPNPVVSTSTSTAIEAGKKKENGQANRMSQSSSLAIIERGGVDNFNGSDRQTLHWNVQPANKREKRHVYYKPRMDNFDVDISALDAERQRKAAALKSISFSKRVKEEVREEGDVLRVGMGGASADGLGDRWSGAGGESREETVGEANGEKPEQVPSPPPRREHSPWTWDGQGNIPGLKATSKSARIHRPYELPRVVNVETTRAVPIPLPSLFPKPSDSISDISDEDLYKVGVDAQVKEEQREDDEDALFDSPVPSSLQTPISAPTIMEQNATMPAVDNSASYPLDTVHPKNKRKQHNLSHAKNVRSTKKVKTDVCALNVGEESKSREALRVQDEEGGGVEVPHASMSAPKKRGKPPKKGKGKKKAQDVATPGEDEMEICAVETKQEEIATGDVLSLVASGAVLTDSQIGTGETIGRKENERPENEEGAAGTEISVAPSAEPLPASVSVHDATRVEDDSVIKRPGRKGKKKGRNGRNKKVKGQTTEAGEQTHHDMNPVGGKEISHPDETLRKKRKVKDQVTAGIDCEAGAGPARDGEESHPDETPRKRTKMNDEMTKGGERTQGVLGGDADIPQQEDMPEKRRTTAADIAQREETPKNQTRRGDDIARPDEAPKVKATDKKEKYQATGGGSVTVDDIVRPDKTSKKKGNQTAPEGVPEAKNVVSASEEKKDEEDTNGGTSLVNVPVKEVKGKTPKGRKKRATMDGITDGVIRKKKRVKLALEEDEDRQSGKNGKSTVKWMLVCKNRTATGRKASRQGKGKEKAQSIVMTPDMDECNEEAEGNVKTRKTLRPSIWASSKAELLLVLPELSGSKCFNGITEGSSNFPMVMLDESTAEGICVDVRWFDGEESENSGETPSVRLTLARDFICPVAERAGIPLDSVPHTAPSDPGPSSQPNVPSYTPPSTSFVLNAYGNGCGIDGPPLPVVPPQMQRFTQAPTRPTYHPVIQFGQHNPIPFSTPSTFSFPALQIQHLLPFQQYQIPVPQYDTPPVPIPIPTLRTPIHDEKPSPPTPSELKSEPDTLIPASPPPDVEILTSSWRHSLPLILISSHETFKRHFWEPLKPPLHSNGPGHSPEQIEKLGLAADQAYVFLGFFRVVKMSQRRVTLSDEERIDLRPGKVAGRVEWTFDVEWVPGYHGSKGGDELSRPWWAPDFVFGRPVGREREKKKGFTWSEKHAQARLNLLPMQLVDGQEVGSSDEAMPKGWLCKTCGKLNQKVMMRHRWCGSRMCRDNPLSRGYAVDLSSARDANQTLLALPITTYNRRTVDASVADWDDGMRTLKYRPMVIPNRLGNAGERGGILQHVFTCNLVDLQTEATPLFESIQREVCLMKSTGDSGPLFKSRVSNSYANKRDKYGFSCLSWSEAPQAVKGAKDLMTFMGKYGEEETLDIDHLTIIGWVSSGTRKTPMILAAREHTIAMLCLGNDVVLTIVPRWEVSAPVPCSLRMQESSNLSYPPFVPDAEMVYPAALPPSMPVMPRVENFAHPKIQSTLARTPKPIKPLTANQIQLVDVTAAPATEYHVQQVGIISENPPSGVVPAQVTSRSKPASKLKPKPTQTSESMSVTLVHGDMLLFSGCDFEYSIKRMGTSILVIGSKEDSTASI